jgi:hypothetical protein
MTTEKVYLNSQSVTLNKAERPMDRENRVRYKLRKDTIFIRFIERERKQRFPYMVYCLAESRNADKQRVSRARSVTNRELWYIFTGV